MTSCYCQAVSSIRPAIFLNGQRTAPNSSSSMCSTAHLQTCLSSGLVREDEADEPSHDVKTGRDKNGLVVVPNISCDNWSLETADTVECCSQTTPRATMDA